MAAARAGQILLEMLRMSTERVGPNLQRHISICSLLATAMVLHTSTWLPARTQALAICGLRGFLYIIKKRRYQRTLQCILSQNFSNGRSLQNMLIREWLINPSKSLAICSVNMPQEQRLSIFRESLSSKTGGTALQDTCWNLLTKKKISGELQLTLLLMLKALT